MKIRMIIALLLLVLFPQMSYAAKDGETEASFSLGYIQTSGNTDTQTLSAKTLVEREKNRHKTLLEGEAVYGKTAGEKSAEMLNLTGRWEYRLNGFFPFWNVNYYRNPFQKYNYRVSTGPGLGYYFIDSENAILTGSYNALYNQDSLTEGSKRMDTYFLHNVEERYKRKLTPTLNFRQKAVYTLSSRSSNDYYLKMDAGIVNKLSGNLALEVSYAANYQNLPVSRDVKRLDTTFTTSITINF